MKHKLLSILLLTFLTDPLLSQDIKAGNFYEQIKNYNLSSIWVQDKIVIDDGDESIDRPEPIGFLGDDYYRFFIHFISVIQNSENAYQYFVFGKTRFKDNICAFQGTITIIESNLYKESDAPGFKQGYIKAHYEFFEDGKQKGSGKLQGNCITNFLIDKKGKLRYDALNIVADGFSNNEFKGTWQSYNSKEIKVCNWGDFRIPDSGPLDGGAGEFMITEGYEKFGWENYAKAWMSSKPESENAKKIEKEKWWE